MPPAGDRTAVPALAASMPATAPCASIRHGGHRVTRSQRLTRLHNTGTGPERGNQAGAAGGRRSNVRGCTKRDANCSSAWSASFGRVGPAWCRLNRGGNRQANNALRRIAITRLRVDQRTIDYAQRRRAQDKTRREILRCLKRHIAREIYRLLTDPPQTPHGADLRRARQRARLTHRDTGQALNVPLTRISELERGLRHNNDLAKRHQQHLAQLPT